MIDPNELNHGELVKAFDKLRAAYIRLRQENESLRNRNYSNEIAAENWYRHEQNERSKQGIFG